MKPESFQIPKADLAPSGTGPASKYREPVQIVSGGKISCGAIQCEVRTRDAAPSIAAKDIPAAGPGGKPGRRNP